MSDFKMPQLVQEKNDEVSLPWYTVSIVDSHLLVIQEPVIRFEPRAAGMRGSESESTVDLKATNIKETRDWFDEILYRLAIMQHLVHLA